MLFLPVRVFFPAIATALVMWLLLAGVARPCELCAIYSAANARGENNSGWLFTVAQQVVHYGDLRYEGEPFDDAAFLDDSELYSSITHLVPGYNFSPRFGLSLNVPVVYRQFNRYEIRYVPVGGALVSRVRHEEGSIFGVGDAALVARWTPWQKTATRWSALVNVLAGVKFPTGDTDRIEDEVEQAERALIALGADHEHTSLPIHQSELSPGSGSFDGIFGATLHARYRRFFLNQQLQYYLRTEAHHFRFGNEFIASGGPGAYVLLQDNYTVSLQANFFYEDKGRDEIIGRKSNFSGSQITYVGPLVSLTWGDGFSAYAGAEFPIDVYNHGLQLLPDYRIRAGLVWRF